MTFTRPAPNAIPKQRLYLCFLNTQTNIQIKDIAHTEYFYFSNRALDFDLTSLIFNSQLSLYPSFLYQIVSWRFNNEDHSYCAENTYYRAGEIYLANLVNVKGHNSKSIKQICWVSNLVIVSKFGDDRITTIWIRARTKFILPLFYLNGHTSYMLSEILPVIELGEIVFPQTSSPSFMMIQIKFWNMVIVLLDAAIFLDNTRTPPISRSHAQVVSVWLYYELVKNHLNEK